MRLDPGAEAAVGAGLAQRRRIGFVGVEIGFVGRHDRLLRRQRARLLERAGQLARLDLGCLDVGLVERIDAEDGAGHRRRHLEAEELLADMVDRLHDDADHGMAGRLQRGEFFVMRGVVFALGADVDEEAVVAVESRDRPAARRRSGSGPCRPCRWIPRSVARPRRRNRRSFSTTRSSPCRGLRGRRGPCASPSCTPGFSCGGTSAPQERTIASVCLIRLLTSMPAAAAGTSPNGDSTE